MKEHQITVTLTSVERSPKVNVSPDNVLMVSDKKGGWYLLIGERGFKPSMLALAESGDVVAAFESMSVDVSDFRLIVHVRGFSSYLLEATLLGNAAFIEHTDTSVIVKVTTDKVKTNQAWYPTEGYRKLAI